MRNKLQTGIANSIGPDIDSKQRVYDIIQSCPHCGNSEFGGVECIKCNFNADDNHLGYAVNIKEPGLEIIWKGNNKGNIIIEYRNFDNIAISQYSVEFDFRIIHDYIGDDVDTLYDFNIKYPELIAGARIIDRYLYDEMRKINIESEIRTAYYSD